MRTHNKKCLDNCIKASLGRWQGWQESNPQRRFWRPELYHLTTSLALDIIPKVLLKYNWINGYIHKL